MTDCLPQPIASPGVRPARPARAALAIYWDYDTQWGGDRSPHAWKDWGDLEVENTERILEIFAQFNAVCTFACVGRAALPGPRGYSSPDQIRRIHQLGHEVASHTHQHEFLPNLSPRALRATLADSRKALQDCIGHDVVSFVPPYNEPFCCLRTGAVSLASFRRRLRGQENTVDDIATALCETGYQTYRVSDWRKAVTVFYRLTKRIWARPVYPMRLHGVTCLALNGVNCLGEDTRSMLPVLARRGGLLVAYAHPHSLRHPEQAQRQGEEPLVRLLQTATELRQQGLLDILTARQAARMRRS